VERVGGTSPSRGCLKIAGRGAFVLDRQLADKAYIWWRDNPMHAGRWVKKDPSWQPMLPTERKPRGRSPVHTRYKRTEESKLRDQTALRLRQGGWKLQAIADLLRYHDRAGALRGVRRAENESQGNKPGRTRLRQDNCSPIPGPQPALIRLTCMIRLTCTVRDS
jgi:hypothetical protein